MLVKIINPLSGYYGRTLQAMRSPYTVGGVQAIGMYFGPKEIQIIANKKTKFLPSEQKTVKL